MAKVWNTYLTNLGKAFTNDGEEGSYTLSKVTWERKPAKYTDPNFKHSSLYPKSHIIAPTLRTKNPFRDDVRDWYK